MILQAIQETLSAQREPIVPNLLQTGAKALQIAAQIQNYKTVVVFFHDRKEIELNLTYLHALGIEDVAYYPTPSLSPYEWTGEERLSSHQRHQIRYRLLNTDTPPKCILMTYQALAHLMMDKLTWYQSTLTLYPGDIISPPELVQTLIQLGYEPVNWVSERGQFTRRGAVLDIYPVGLDRVIRIEWFDDEIEKVFSYKLNDTLEKPKEEKQGVILPAYEWLIPTDLKSLKIKLMENHRGNFIQLLKNFQYQADLYQIMSFFHPVSNILGSLPERSLLIWPEGLWHKCKAYIHMLDETALQRQIKPMHCTLEELKASIEPFDQQHLSGHDGKQTGILLPPLERALDPLVTSLKLMLKQDKLITIISPQPQRIMGILQERSCPVTSTKKIPVTGEIQVIQGSLPAGFAYAPMNWFCFTDRELFQNQGHLTRKTHRKRQTSPIQLSQLKEGILVVHDIHGIGRFQGLVQYSTTGETREYLSVQYAGTDRLLVPVEHMHRLQIYHGVGGQRLKLHKLGGTEWEKAKAKVKKNLVEIAEQLLRTEAARMQAEGFAIPEDTEWQREMEFAFPYEETPDQLKAIQDSKADMEKPLPMNRLICGDVGFGKTEVALRAAFKAAISGYQVAILAPTTILAHQHYQVLKDRFASYPIQVELLSRYRSPKESDQIFKDIQSGATEIIVATHRILSKKLSFHKLGLLIIDEEHRFGVNQKEKLKQLQPNVDILTMSATPIPRTLNIALGGLKSLSLIETPPPNRHSIETHVHPFDEDIIQKSVYHELQRGGQIYYIHNRVKSIHDVGRRLQELVPQARIRVAHGQMSKQELERTMWDFYHHEFDILVCTTIVESGLDISNVNTLIIENVELLGLAQIHQLRGRVGRSSIQAYAYLFHDAVKPLTREAKERLSVVQEYSELGSGYYLALKDMEIRGIGNLVGPQQHGNIVTVGFETYCQLLEETIATLKGEPIEDHKYTSCIIDLNLSAYIPDTWLKDIADKMRLYRILGNAVDLDYLAEVHKNTIDKYGPMPTQAETLWNVSKARIMANDLRLDKIAYDGNFMVIEGSFSQDQFLLAQRKFPEIKNWKIHAQRLQFLKTTSGNRNLQIVEKLLNALTKTAELQSEEIVYV